ncbi:GNAT family N-acetyltransferase [Paenibacillus antarcticus]|uniref:N-acetyltransferase domain-containing protein n=1 Tax=Paenibacillus antarcticus TaxID=253703 RepID=A0A168QZT2_9BACL|nr:GNAT family N-acetyltransferase [Paenibacillus antarcticus]OAB48407.1 hypothetical protein PBAT_01895 [Paenibacillus antarcticus]
MESIVSNAYVNERVTASQANMRDTQDIMDILIETARWLQSRGSSQWSGLLRGEDSHDMVGSISRGEVFAFKENGVCVGTVILKQMVSEWDKDLWGENEGELNTSVFVHRLAIHRDHAGKGLGADILRWIESGVCYNDKDRIRLDCIGDNITLNRFYSQCGYKYMGGVNGFSKYEKLL